MSILMMTFLRDDEAQDLIEYTLLLAFVCRPLLRFSLVREEAFPVFGQPRTASWPPPTHLRAAKPGS